METSDLVNVSSNDEGRPMRAFAFDQRLEVRMLSEALVSLMGGAGLQKCLRALQPGLDFGGLGDDYDVSQGLVDRRMLLTII